MLRMALVRITWIVLLLLLPADALAQENDNPVIALLRFGSSPSFGVTEGAILDILESYGFISGDENRILEERKDLEGENINIYWGEADDFPSINFIVNEALDREADVLVTLTTPLTQIAVKATSELDDPPTVLFTSVYNPYEAGIAEASCIKPAHVTGSESLTPYEYVLSILLAQDPNLKTIGTIYNASDSPGIWGARHISELAVDYGLTVETAVAVTLADLHAAAAILVDKGVEAIVLPVDDVVMSGLPIIATVANENGIPVFYPGLSSIYYGATVGAGFYLYYEQGINVGRMLVAHLNGEIDIATTGINLSESAGLGVNLDSASLQGIELSQELLAQVDVVVEGGEDTILSPELQLALAKRDIVVPMEDRLADDRAFLEALHCSEERISQQKAQLNAAK